MTDTPAICPKSRRMNKGEIASFFEVSLPTVESWIRKGMPILHKGSRGRPWTFDALEVTRWRFSPTFTFSNSEPGSLPPAQRKSWFESEVIRRNLLARDTELIPIDEIHAMMTTAVSTIADALNGFRGKLTAAGVPDEAAWLTETELQEALSGIESRLAEHLPHY